MYDIRRGELIVIAGCMFSSKTLEGREIANRFGHAGHVVQGFRADRVDPKVHAGVDLSCEPASTSAQIFERLNPSVGVVRVDDAQFFDQEIVDLAFALVDSGRIFIASGLDMNFRREGFGPMPALLLRAHQAFKKHAVCSSCRVHPAVYSQLSIDGKPAHWDSPADIIGRGNYQPSCTLCHEVPGAPESAFAVRVASHLQKLFA